jgi:hypothetical protein
MVAHLFFIVIFCRSESPFFSSRAGFVRATLVRPHFDGLEHDGTFSAVGMTIEGSPLPGAVQSRHNLVSGRSEDPNHDAVMRIGSEAPKRRTHSSNRHESQGTCRKSATSNRHRCPSQAYEQGRNRRGAFSAPIHCAGRKTTPSGTTPSHTSRHRAMRSLRAKATIMGLRAPRAFSVRARNHCAKALSFW